MTFNSHFSFAPLHHSTLGFETLFDEVEKMLSTTELKSNNSFPPHNIVKVDEYHYIVELAVAGFSKDEIDITVEESTLIIKGAKKDRDVEVTYLHRGIGTRSFTKTLHIADTIEVRGAEFEDGILRIGLENVIPDHKKPRKIEIGNELKLTQAKLLTESAE